MVAAQALAGQTPATPTTTTMLTLPLSSVYIHLYHYILDPPATGGAVAVAVAGAVAVAVVGAVADAVAGAVAGAVAVAVTKNAKKFVRM